MAKPLILVGGFLISASAAFGGGFKAMSFGDGGGYTQPDSATQQFLDGDAQNPPAANASAAPVSAPALAPQVADAASRAPAAPPVAVIVPSAAPALIPPAATRSAFTRPRPAAVAPPVAASAAARRESLWNGVVRPLAISPGITSDDPDTASAAAAEDYGVRVLGQAAGPRKALVAHPGSASAAPGVSAAASAPRPDARLFVSLEIDPREAGSLRDAVAGLGASAGFAADGRFEPALGTDGIARIAGWLPAARLADVLNRPGVKSVRVDTALPAPDASTFSRFLVGLRVSDPARAQQEVESSLRDMAASVGFRATRVVGLETAPDGSAVALVEGRLALTNLPAVMGRSDVVRIEPLMPSAAPVAAAPSARGLAGFASFVYEHGLWLILLTLLAALPVLRGAAAGLAGLFNPYR